MDDRSKPITKSAVKKAGGKVGVTFAFLCLTAGFLFATQTPSATAQRATPQELLSQNDPYPLAPETPTSILSSRELSNPIAMAVDSSGYIFVSNTTGVGTIINRLNDAPSAADAYAGALNVFRLSPSGNSLIHVTSVSIPTAPPQGWNGETYPDNEDGTPYVPTAADLYETSQANHPTVWKPELQNVAAIHIGADGALYIGEAPNSIGFYNPNATDNATIGQNRLIYALPSGSDPSQGYIQYRSILIDPNEFGNVTDIATDSNGLIYVLVRAETTNTRILRASEPRSQILVYQRVADSINKIGQLDITPPTTLNSITFGDVAQTDNILYASVIISATRGRPNQSGLYIYNTNGSGGLTQINNLTDDFSFLGTNCREQKYIGSLNSRGQLIVREGRYSGTHIFGVTVDEFKNVYVVDSGSSTASFGCSNIVTFTPNTVGDTTSGYLPASVIGGRNLFLRSKNQPEEALDPITTTAVDYNPGFNFNSATDNNADIHVDTANNVIYSLQTGGQEKGVKISPTGVAQLRQGWNLINWGGSDDPDGDGPHTAITTAAELADYISQDDVRTIWSLDPTDQTWSSWPDGGLTSLENSAQLFIRMNSGGRFLPYIFQDSTPAQPIIYPNYTMLTYRGTDVAAVNCADDPPPAECSYVNAPTRPSNIEYPYASCLVDSATLAANEDEIRGVFWWSAAEARWTKGYYPQHPDYNPDVPGFEVVRDTRSANEDQTAISFDDTIVVYLKSTSGNAYQGAWRELCSNT